MLDERDYCVLKPKPPTPLDTLLSYIGAKELMLTGISGTQCVPFTANDAYVRDLGLHIPSDCIALPTQLETQQALQHFEKVIGANVSKSTQIRLHRH